MNYCADPFSYQRRLSREVRVGNIGIGGDNPIRVQSMITCDTMDTEASIAQTIELAEAGCEIVRITAPTVKDAANLQHIVRGLRERGCDVRIVTNHGSLSDRIMNRYGDTPLGMVESALEFARIARDLDYHDFIFSMKASNPKIMIAAYRLLAARLNELGPEWNYPLHLGVTEAGEGEDARITSAIGIGSLLADGIGDTIRVSLTEDSPHEIPVAKALIENIKKTPNPPSPWTGSAVA